MTDPSDPGTVYTIAARYDSYEKPIQNARHLEERFLPTLAQIRAHGVQAISITDSGVT